MLCKYLFGRLKTGSLLPVSYMEGMPEMSTKRGLSNKGLG